MLVPDFFIQAEQLLSLKKSGGVFAIARDFTVAV
jgi:hypothetical protein